MNIVYASNDNYAKHLAVSLYSLLDHNQDRTVIDIYILSMELSDRSKKRLNSVARSFRRRIQFIELGDLKKRFSHDVDTGGFDISIMARLFVGEVLPKTVDRILYLDCDTVILNSLKNLWDRKLAPYMAAAVMEPTIYPKVKALIGLGENDPYFNSGVLLIDLDRWRKENAQSLLLEFYKGMNGRLFAGDQDTINGALKGRIKALPPKYNFFTNYRYFRYSHLVRLSPVYGGYSRESFQKAKVHPAILHFMGDERPWIKGNFNHYRRAYNHYLKETPWRHSKKEPGRRFYMILYHMMDYATYLCPPTRDFVSERYGMRAINSRKASKQERS